MFILILALKQMDFLISICLFHSLWSIRLLKAQTTLKLGKI